MTKEAIIKVNGEPWGNYGQAPDQSDNDFYNEVKRVEAEITREAYRETSSVNVTIEYRLPKDERQVMAVLNSKPSMKFIESDKQAFRASLTRLHENGQYIAFSKKQDKWIVTSGKPETLVRQINQRDQLVESLFQRKCF